MSNSYKYTVKPGQNMIDIALQHYGSVDAVINLCLDNNLDVGAELKAGTELTINDQNIIDKRLVTYYKNNNITVASE